MPSRLLIELLAAAGALLGGLWIGYSHTKAEWSAKYDLREAEIQAEQKGILRSNEILVQNHDAKVASERKTYEKRIAAADAATLDLLALVRKQALGAGSPDAGTQGAGGDSSAAGAAGGNVVMHPAEAAVWIARGADRDLATLAFCRNTMVNPVR